MTNPRALAIDPRAKSRFIFWTDCGKRPRIERANLDGANRTVLISTKLYWPNDLTLDLVKKRIYFADAHLDYIESCDYFGGKRVQIFANSLALHHPHCLSFFEHSIYWVDRGHQRLVKINRYESALVSSRTNNVTYIPDLSAQALNVRVAHQLAQPVDTEANPCDKSSCEHLCLLSRDSPTGFKCACQIGYVKNSTLDSRCNLDQSEFLIVLKRNVIGGLKVHANDTQDDTVLATTVSTGLKSRLKSFCTCSVEIWCNLFCP